jgi:CMP/dCMP kinase
MNSSKNFVIAVDGPASSGKGTLCDHISASFGFFYFDSGMFYRRVAIYLNEKKINSCDLNFFIARIANSENYSIEKIKSEKTGELASELAKEPAAKSLLSSFQRKMTEDHPFLIMDGRDIGTYVFPDADIKFFLTADIDERAKRRALELGADLAEIKSCLTTRDRTDILRRDAPLRRAHDAITIDSTTMTPDEVFKFAKEQIQRKIRP